MQEHIQKKIPKQGKWQKCQKLNLYTDEMANDWIDENDEPITTGAKNNLKVEENGKLTELGIELGSDYDDPKWEDVLIS